MEFCQLGREVLVQNTGIPAVFAGTLNGDGHKIIGLYSDSNRYYAKKFTVLHVEFKKNTTTTKTFYLNSNSTKTELGLNETTQITVFNSNYTTILLVRKVKAYALTVTIFNGIFNNILQHLG